MGVGRTINLILLPLLLSFFVYDRRAILATFYYNDPARLRSVAPVQPSEIKFADVARNCEDVHLVAEKGIALLSCDPGRDEWNTVMGTFIESKHVGDLFVYNYGADGSLRKLELKSLSEPLATEFHPLGLTFHAPSSTLFVVDLHSEGAAIERFKVDLEAGEAVFQGTFKHDLLRTPNSLVALSEHELLVTNDHYFKAIENPVLAKAETYLGLPGGTVAYVNLETGDVKTLTRIAFANGIARVNSTTFAVASCSKVAIYLFSWDSEAKTLTQTSQATLPFIPDNLSVDSDGKVLVAGHPHAPSLEALSSQAYRWLEDGDGEGERPKAPSWAAEWDPKTDTITDLYVGTDYDTSSTAARDVQREVLIVTGLYAKGLLVKTGKAAFGKEE